MKVLHHLKDLPADSRFDLAVVGAGGAGLACALFAALQGRSVLLIESTAWVGGTTAWSAGSTWVPGTRQGLAINPGDTLEQAARYLQATVGENAPAALQQAFLANGPDTIAELEVQTEVWFRAYPRHPDYLSDLPGATLCGRTLEPLPFDGRQLGPLFGLLRPPIPEFTVLGGMMVDRTDINHLLSMGRSFASWRHAVRIVLRHVADRLRYPRGTRLVMGNALVGRLLHSLARHPRVTLVMECAVERLLRGASGVEGLVVKQGPLRRPVQVHGGVVLSTGGFNRNAERRAHLLPGMLDEWCPGAPGHTGAAHALAEALGAHYGKNASSHAFWAPVSTRRRADGSTAVFPHFVMDRAKPGMLLVNQAGERFLNESLSYHRFALEMQAAHASSPAIPAYLVCDAVALRKYGLGLVRPGGRGLTPFLADGYLIQGGSLDELAGNLGIDAAGLKVSVTRMNAHAKAGTDPDFGRGQTAYERNIGDPAWRGTNPCLGPLETAPFYAIRLFPGDIGAATGLATDERARVLGSARTPIAGLYAVGNDMQSVMGGAYPGPGIALGPAFVFARLAARDAAERATMAERRSD